MFSYSYVIIKKKLNIIERGIRMTEEKTAEKLLVVWSSGDREVALRMILMYTRNAKKYDWWKEIQLLIWGPSARLLATDEELQAYIHNMKNEGILITACKACADSYSVSDKLLKMGIDVEYVGEKFTGFLKEDWTVVTF